MRTRTQGRGPSRSRIGTAVALTGCLVAGLAGCADPGEDGADGARYTTREVDDGTTAASSWSRSWTATSPSP
jgi:hypothetical protein